MTVQLQKSMFFAAILVASQWSARAAEIHFQADATVARGIVRLGDVAEIITGDDGEARLLEGIALVPAPDVDQSRLLKRQEVQQLLQLSGVQLREHRFSGAEVTQLRAGMPIATHNVRKVASAVELIPTVIPAEQQPATEANAAARIGQALVSHLNAVSDFPAE